MTAKQLIEKIILKILKNYFQHLNFFTSLEIFQLSVHHCRILIEEVHQNDRH